MTATAAKKHSQNVTLSADLAAAPQGPEKAVRQARAEAWRDDNRAALDVATAMSNGMACRSANTFSSNAGLL